LARQDALLTTGGLGLFVGGLIGGLGTGGLVIGG